MVEGNFTPESASGAVPKPEKSNTTVAREVMDKYRSPEIEPDMIDVAINSRLHALKFIDRLREDLDENTRKVWQDELKQDEEILPDHRRVLLSVEEISDIFQRAQDKLDQNLPIDKVESGEQAETVELVQKLLGQKPDEKFYLEKKMIGYFLFTDSQTDFQKLTGSPVDEKNFHNRAITLYSGGIPVVVFYGVPGQQTLRHENQHLEFMVAYLSNLEQDHKDSAIYLSELIALLKQENVDEKAAESLLFQYFKSELDLKIKNEFLARFYANLGDMGSEKMAIFMIYAQEFLAKIIDRFIKKDIPANLLIKGFGLINRTTGLSMDDRALIQAGKLPPKMLVNKNILAVAKSGSDKVKIAFASSKALLDVVSVNSGQEEAARKTVELLSFDRISNWPKLANQAALYAKRHGTPDTAFTEEIL